MNVSCACTDIKYLACLRGIMKRELYVLLGIKQVLQVTSFSVTHRGCPKVFFVDVRASATPERKVQGIAVPACPRKGR